MPSLTPERALADARRLDDETAGRQIARAAARRADRHKDLCDTQGVPTAAGMAIRRDHVPAKDATVVTRLKQAGAVILGKLQMTEGAYGLHHPSVDPPVKPVQRRLLDRRLVLRLGRGDRGGPLLRLAGLRHRRLDPLPSTMNGLSGLKPTWGRVSRAGSLSAGRIARSCRADAAAARWMPPSSSASSPAPIPTTRPPRRNLCRTMPPPSAPA